MARNMVQLRKGLSEAEFAELYGTEEKCRATVIASRWPNGFVCPACGGRVDSEVKTRGLFQCSSCRRQTSPIAGTIFASTHLALHLWFRAMDHLTQSKQGISSIELGRRLGVRQNTAWKIKHKLAQVMMERDATKPLTGRVGLDDAYVGGERSGGEPSGGERGRGERGRGAPGKTPFVAAIETTAAGKPVRLKLPWPTPGVGIRSSRQAQAPPRHAPPPSNGSTRRLAISKRPSPGPIARSMRSMCRATLPSSNTDSTADTISPP